VTSLPERLDLDGLAEQAAAATYLAAWRTVRWAPESVARRAFDVIADGLWQQRAGGVAQLERNLARVLGPEHDPDDLRRLSRQAMRAYLQYWCDAFRLPSMPVDEVVARVVVTGFDRVEAAQASGRGAVLALPHQGNWDLLGAWLAATHGPFTTVAERLRPESLHRRFVEYREGLGMEVLPLSGEAQLFAALATRLRAGGTVCLLGDRDLGGHGPIVELFGEPARMPGGPAALAITTGAALFPVSVHVSPEHGYQVRAHVGDELVPGDQEPRSARVAALTARLGEVFAASIAAHPQDWHMMQPMWIADRPTDASAGTATAS
jgi:KDO2-lipid IV(A) lauroyltransferase